MTKGTYTTPFAKITEENIEEYAKWCNGIVVDDMIVFKDKMGIMRTAKTGGNIIRRQDGALFSYNRDIDA